MAEATPPRRSPRSIRAWLNSTPTITLAVSLVLVNIAILLLTPILISGLSYSALVLPLATSLIASLGMIIGARQHIGAGQVRQMELNAATFAENLPVMLLAIDSSGTLVAWNRACEATTGYSAAEMVGNRHWREYLSPDPAQREAARAKIAAWGGRFRDWEEPVTCRDGSQRFISWTNISADFPVPGWQSWSLGVDVTERRAIQRSQQFIAEASQVLALTLDFNTTLHNLSQLIVPRLADWCVVDMLESDGKFHRLAAIHADPAKSELIRELQERYQIIAPDTKHTVLKVFRENQSWLDPNVDQERFVREARDADHLRILTGLGFKSEIVVSLAAREQLLGTITLVSGTRSFNQRDLMLAEELARRAALSLENARLYEAEQRARGDAEKAQQRLAFLAEASNTLSASLDSEAVLNSVVNLAVPRLADGCVVDLFEADNAVRRVAVAHVDPVLKKLCFELQRGFPPSVETATDFARSVRSGQSRLVPEMSDDHLVSIAVDADHLDVLRRLQIKSYMIVPLAAHGRLMGIISFINSEPRPAFTRADLDLSIDLGHRAAIAVDNAQLYREAQTALQIRDQFLSIAAHELKTPLTSLRGYSQILQRRTQRENILNERDKRAVNMIDSQAQRLGKLVDTLLDIARLQMGSFPLERKPLELGAMALRLVEELQPTLEHHTIDLPGLEGPLIVNGDELRLEQVLQNLLQNAIKYSPEGGAISLRISKHDGCAHIAVTDHGIGIPEAAQRNLFQRFYRAMNFDPNHISGMGIGLFVVKEIVSLHDGTISVMSQEGQGSTFTVALPLLAPDTND